jgi:GNAT superfamily N-acetyltransferase
MQSRRANARDDEAVRALLAAVGDELARQGFLNWMPAWSLERVRTVLATRDVYVVHDGTELVASYVLGSTPVTPYTTPPWPTPRLTALYLNRLAVAPPLQRRGVGSWCLGDIDERARAAGALAIRCDVLETNAALHAFYQRHGYVPRGQRSHSGWAFISYEKLIGATD